jgi:hypothetical protein
LDSPKRDIKKYIAECNKTAVTDADCIEAVHKIIFDPEVHVVVGHNLGNDLKLLKLSHIP